MGFREIIARSLPAAFCTAVSDVITTRVVNHQSFWGKILVHQLGGVACVAGLAVSMVSEMIYRVVEKKIFSSKEENHLIAVLKFFSHTVVYIGIGGTSGIILDLFISTLGITAGTGVAVGLTTWTGALLGRIWSASLPILHQLLRPKPNELSLAYKYYTKMIDRQTEELLVIKQALDNFLGDVGPLNQHIHTINQLLKQQVIEQQENGYSIKPLYKQLGTNNPPNMSRMLQQISLVLGALSSYPILSSSKHEPAHVWDIYNKREEHHATIISAIEILSKELTTDLKIRENYVKSIIKI